MDRPWVKALLTSVVGLALFALVVWMTLPTEPLRQGLEQRLQLAVGDGWTVEVLDLGLTGLTAAEVEAVSFTQKPQRAPKPEEGGQEGGDEGAPKARPKRLQMTIDRAEVDFALFKSLFGDTTVNFEVEVGGGLLEGAWSREAYEPLPEPTAQPESKTPIRTRPAPKAAAKQDAEDPGDGDKPGQDDAADDDNDDEGDDDKALLGNHIIATFEAFPLQSIKFIEAKLDLPLNGSVNGDIDLLLSKDGQPLDGHVKLEIERVSLGPGFLPIDTPLGKPEIKEAIRFGTLTLDLVAEGGKLEINTLKTTGPDIFLEANGNITLARQLKDGRAKLNVRVKPSDEFLNKNSLSVLLNANPKIKRAKAGEWYGLLVSGTLADIGKGEGFFPSSRTASGLHKADK